MKIIIMKWAYGVLAIVLAMVFSGCYIDDDDGYDDYDDYCYDCYYDDPVPVREWWVVGPDWLTLSVGGGCGSGCDMGCGWFEESWAWDTIYLTSWDDDIVDLQFNYTLTNWGNYTTSVWVTLCDYLGCVDVLYTDIYPGEVIWDRSPNPVLDTALADFYDCLYYYGDACYFEYDIDVYLGEECVCSPLVLEYYYEGLYVY